MLLMGVLKLAYVLRTAAACAAGFVPPSNPHDTVQLFSSITEALEHLWQQDIAQVRNFNTVSKLQRSAAPNSCGKAAVAARAAGLGPRQPLHDIYSSSGESWSGVLCFCQFALAQYSAQ
jgi:hypothetical protein